MLVKCLTKKNFMLRNVINKYMAKVFINYTNKSILYSYETVVYGFKKKGYDVIINTKTYNFDYKYTYLVEYNDKLYCIDDGDNVFSILTDILDKVDIYYKSQYPSWNMFDQTIVSQYKDLFTDKVLPIYMFRHINKFIKYDNITNSCLTYFTKLFPPKPKKYKLITYTQKIGGTVRLKLYEFLVKHFHHEFIIFTPVRKCKSKILNNCTNIIECNRLGYLEYLKLLNQSYFMLNLHGNHYSNPLRCSDAIISQTCVVSTNIYSKSYQNFPRYDLNLDLFKSQNILDDDELHRKFTYFFNNCEQLYNKLLAKQRDWYSTNLEPINFVNKNF